MNSLFGKFTAYDIISMTIPGFMIVLGICTIIPGTIYKFMISIDNSWFIFIIAISVSYSIGWVISEISKTVINFKAKTIMKEILKPIYFNFVFFIMVSKMYNLSFYRFAGILLLVWIIYDSVMFFYRKKEKKCASESHKKKSDSKSIDMEYHVLIMKCYEYLKRTYPEFDQILKDENDIVKKVEYMSNSAYFLIQTDDKYHRLHNYNSSKSFSKNLCFVCFFWAGILSFHLIFNTTNEYFGSLYAILIIFCLLGFQKMKERYYLFSKKLKILIISYYLDFLENKHVKSDNINNKNLN